MSKLSDRLAARKAELNDVSVRAVSDRAKAAGHQLSQNTVAKYLRADHPQPTPATLDALATGFRLPPSELYRLADARQAGPPFEPHKSADLLTAPQRAAVNEIIRLLADGNQGAAHDTDDTVTPLSARSRPGTTPETTPQKMRPLPADYAADQGPSAGEEGWAQAQELGEESQDDGGDE